MAAMPSSLDEFLPVLSTTDTKIKLSIGTKLYSYLRDPSNSIECSDIGQFIDSLVIWLQSSNYKVAQNSLEILTELVLRMKGDFQTYLQSVLTYIVDKLGDSKETIREKAFGLLKKMMEYDVTSPQQLVDRVSNVAFAHKNSNVREQIMMFLTSILDDYGSQALHISKLVPHIVRLLSDPNVSVRSTAFQTLVNIYKHVGERLRTDLQRKYSIPQNKLPLLMQAFDDIAKSSGRSSDDSEYSSVAVATTTARDQFDGTVSYKNSIFAAASPFDTTNNVLPPLCPPPSSLTSSSVFTTPVCSSSGSGFAASNKNAATSLVCPSSSSGSSRKLVSSASSSASHGGIDEDSFLAAFEDVPTMRIYTGRDVEDFIKKSCALIDNANTDWSKRVESLKMIRSLLLADATMYDEFFGNFNLLLTSFHTSIKDLRSQVVREACITIAFLSKSLGAKFDHFAESLFNNLVNLIQNSAKVMACSGLVCIHFILKYTHNPRIIPVINSNMKSKSKDIRRACSQFIYIVLETWNISAVEKHLALVQDVIKRGVADADQEARTHSRKSYWLFSEYFPDKAEQLLNSLDGNYRKLLTFNSSSSSANNNQQQHNNPPVTTKSSSSCSSKASTTAALPLHHSRNNNNNNNNNDVHSIISSSYVKVKTSPRSSSAVDLQAAKRAKVRAQYAALARNKIAAAACLPKPSGGSAAKRPMVTPPPLKDQQALERAGRTKNRMSISQPTSRSSSPSSKFSYNSNMIYNPHHAHYQHHYHNHANNSNHVNSGSPSLISRPQRCLQTPKSRSTNTSREPSPNRFGGGGPSIKCTAAANTSSGSSRIPTQPIYKPVIAQKILQQSQEAESALADALGTRNTNVNNNNNNNNSTNSWSLSSNASDSGNRSFRRIFRSLEDHSDESETSSICSDHSFDFPRKSFDSHSWNESSSAHWLLQHQHHHLHHHHPPHQQQSPYSNSPIDWKSPPSMGSGGRGILEIIALCKSSFWNERKEGLIAVQYYIDSGGDPIEPKDLKQLMEVFVKIFNDPHTKVFGLYLDALNKLIVSHHNQMNFCLRLLLTRLLNKLGTDLLSSVQTKIMKTLHTVLVSFPADLQMHSVFQFLVDPTQTPNAQVKIAALNYIAKLTYMTDPSLVFNNSSSSTSLNSSDSGNVGGRTAASSNKKDYADLAFMKIVDWIVADDGIKSRADVRKAAEDCMIALFNLNTPEITFRFSSLSYEKQQKVTDLIKSKLNTSTASSSSGGSAADNKTGSSSSKKPVRNGSIHHLLSSNTENNRLDDDSALLFDSCSDDSSNIDASLKKLTLAIRDTLSVDDVDCNNGSGGGSISSAAIDTSDNINTNNNNTNNNTNNATTIDEVEEDGLKKLIDSLSNETSSDVRKKDFLLQLDRTIQEISSSEAIVKHFRILLRLILALISEQESAAVKELALRLLQTLATRKTITFCFKDYIELILLKVMNVSRDPDKDVGRAVENSAIILSTYLPVEYTIRVVVPLITSDDYPINLLAIKMLTRLVERSKECVYDNVNHIMPSLLTAYDNPDSCVRKSAVFCMVALHTELGEEILAPYINTLSTAKIKLLRLYIEKAQKGSINI